MHGLKRAPVTAALLIIIAIVWGLEVVFEELLHSNALFAFGAILGGTLDYREYWRLLTAMFMHGSWLHWLANSWALYQLGALYEIMFGWRRFLAIYFITGLCASVASAMRLPLGESSVGASGAIFGILGAFIFSIRRSPQWRHEPWTRSLTSQLVFWALVNLALGASVKFIDNTAHIAGMISGLALGFLPHRVAPPPPSAHVIEVTPYEAPAADPDPRTAGR
jgi:rhomboid protease GluP